VERRERRADLWIGALPQTPRFVALRTNRMEGVIGAVGIEDVLAGARLGGSVGASTRRIGLC